MNKYGNRKTIIDNIEFASKKEADRYLELRILLRAGEISRLEMQPKFLLMSGFTDFEGKKHRETYYVADFSYCEGYNVIVEDVKGFKTPVYQLKKKMFLKNYRNIIFREI